MKIRFRRRARWIVTLAALLAGAAGVASLWPGAAPPVGTLVTLQSEDNPGATAIAFVPPAGTPRILTTDYATASSPAISWDGTRFVFAARSTASSPAGLYEMQVAGSAGRLLTQGNGDPSDPAWLPDGRILYSDNPEPGATGPVSSLFALDPASGASTRLTWGLHRDVLPRVRRDGLVSFERLSGPGASPASGVIMTIRPDGTGITLSPEPDPRPEPAPEGVTPPAGYRVVAAVSAGPRRAPRVLTSVVDPNGRTGTLLCLDVRASRLPGVASLPAGAVAAVRVSSLGPGGATPVAEAPVHEDGSFYVEVPADTSLGLTLIGQQGQEIASLDSGIWVRPNENRGCIGCHEEPDRVPENRIPLAVKSPPARGYTATADARRVP